MMCFFFSSRRRHTRWPRDWSSDVCSSDLILPWGAPRDVERMSPVDASARLLRHILEAWNAACPETRMQAQEVVITVPASFDEIARALTVNAARQAGFDKFMLLEEPQAAFYDFIANHRNNLGA